YLLNARNPTPEKKAEHLRRIERQVELADNVISSLSSFAKMPALDLQPIPIEPVLREALEINPPSDGIQVAVACPPDLPPVLGNGDQRRNVFGNLIRNASEAMPQGGQLTIVGRHAVGVVEVAVADTGVGIPPEA